MNSYQSTLEYLYSQLPMFQRVGASAFKKDLTNTIKLCEHLNNPQSQFKSIHIAGTNGKGSVSHTIASILQEAGYKTGLYTSPHLRDFRERVRINGKMISQNEVIEFVNTNRVVFDDIKPSFFEMTVALAFDSFVRHNTDIVVVETGMGGRFDSTNIISPQLSVITNIGYDHTQFLGDTLEQIAFEKAGIIKPNIPVIIGEKNYLTKDVFEQKAAQCNSDIIFADEMFSTEYSMLSIDNKQVFNIYKQETLTFPNLKTDLLGIYQRKNILTILASIMVLQKQNWTIDISHIYNGVANVSKNTGLLGRWQILDTNPLTICDTGHNAEGIGFVLEQIQQTPHKCLHFVLGFVSDKDIHKILEMLPKQATYYFTQANIPRALAAQELWRKAKDYGLNGTIIKDVKTALSSARKLANKNDLVFVGGSTFVVAEIV